MATTEHAVPVAGTNEALRTFQQLTAAGRVQSEAITVVGPDSAGASIADVVNATPSNDAYGLTVRIAGPVTLGSSPTIHIGEVDQGAAGIERWIVDTGLSQPLTDTQLRASAVSVSVNNLPAVQPVSQSGAWSANTNLQTVNGSAFALGQTTGAASLPVVIASNQSAVPVSQSSPGALVAFITAVTTAGTRVQLGNNSIAAGILQAPSTNTGLIYVGGATVSSSVYGAELQPGQSVGVSVNNTNLLYIDASVNGDKCAFMGS